MGEKTTVLHRFAPINKPEHMDAYLKLFPREVALREKYGFHTFHASLDKGDMIILTWLYTYEGEESMEEALKKLMADPEKIELDKEAAPHIHTNYRIRKVDLIFQEELQDLAAIKDKTLVMRRYSIKRSGWDEHCENMKKIIPLRTEYGFVPVFEAGDREESMFTWAFRFEGKWEDFRKLQYPYYTDPRRVPLDANNNNLTDIVINPAQEIFIPGFTVKA